MTIILTAILTAGRHEDVVSLRYSSAAASPVNQYRRTGGDYAQTPVGWGGGFDFGRRDRVWDRTTMQHAATGRPATGIGPVLIIALAIVTSLAAAAAVNAAPTDPSRVAIVFPPWWSAAHAVTAAASAGDVLGVGGVPFIVIVHGDPSTAARRARSVGALFMMGADPRSLCSSTRSDSAS